jgi:RNA polymerase sigma-70 factor (ECF subfamily)
METYDSIHENTVYQWQLQIAAGDLKAFRQLFDFFAEKLTHFAYSLSGNKETALEIMDEVFVRIWKNRETLPEIRNLTTYLYTSIKNTSLNYLSRKTRELLTEPFDFVNVQLEQNETPEQNLISSEILKKIQTSVENLPPRCKIIFKLVREDGLKYKEVAEILNISIHTVDAQMVNAVKRISETVRSEFDYFPKKTKKNSESF